MKSFALLLIALSMGCAPLGPIAGGRLRGVIVDIPISDWTFSDAYEKVQVETRPGDPYSVTTWCVAYGNHLYLPSQNPQEKRWVQHVLEDPRVRVRIGERVYRRSAVRVKDETEIRAVADRLIAKYHLEIPEGGERPEVWFFRMHPR